MNPVVIGLLTDFGNDFAVASIKGVLLTELSGVVLVDVDHSIEKFNIRSGAFVIEQVHQFFPENSYFLCIVDPGVGSERKELYVRKGQYHFVGPDNGIFSFLLDDKDVEVYQIHGAHFNPRSHTFHGRDLFAPALAAIARGERSFLHKVSPSEVVRFSCEDNTHYISYIDSFGNIKTDYPWLPETPTPTSITCILQGKSYTVPCVETFSQAPEGALIAYRGSNNTLELAINYGSAQSFLGASAGQQIIIQGLTEKVGK